MSGGCPFSGPSTPGDSPPQSPNQQSPNYWDYLKLEPLLALQGGLEEDGDVASSDELLFIIEHQTYELWFKLVVRSIRDAIGVLSSTQVPEEAIPHVVHHLRRVARVLRLAVFQFEVMETLTPQDFLDFREKLVPASGFQSFQMRQIEILLGLKDEGRVTYGKTSAIEHIRDRAKRGGAGAHAWAQIAQATEEAEAGRTLRECLYSWLYRTPIDGSTPDAEDDAAVIDAFLERYQESLRESLRAQEAGLNAAEVSGTSAISERFAEISEAAERFLFALDVPEKDQRRMRRFRAGLLYIESHRHLPLLAWPRLLVDAIVDMEEQLVLFRSRHARMVERVIGRRIGTGGSSGVAYLDKTTGIRIFRELWQVRTLLLRRDRLPPVRNPEFYGFAVSEPDGSSTARTGEASAPSMDSGSATSV